MRRRILVVLAVVTLVVLAASAALANRWETAELFGQGMSSPVVAEDGAKIQRKADTLTASVRMPTPEPGTYNPDHETWPTSSGVAGHPEVFSQWVFIFFNRDACLHGCDGDDLQNNPEVVAGAFNAGGHPVGGPNLNITGTVTEQSRVFGGDNAETLSEALAMGFDLEDAEIHLAVAPHGALDPDLMPEQANTPAGNPSFWWIALFK